MSQQQSEVANLHVVHSELPLEFSKLQAGTVFHGYIIYTCLVDVL